MPNYRLLRQGAPNLFTNVVGESADVVGESADVVGESADVVGESADVVGESPNALAESPKIRHIHNTTLHNITEQTPNPLKGVFPENLISDKFKKA